MNGTARVSDIAIVLAVAAALTAVFVPLTPHLRLSGLVQRDDFSRPRPSHEHDP